MVEADDGLKTSKISIAPTQIVSDIETTGTSAINSNTAAVSNGSKVFEVRSAFKSDRSKSKRKHKKQNMGKDDSYFYMIRVGANKNGKQYKGLLVNKDIVASVKIPDTTDVELCQNDKCQNALKRKDSKNFSFWSINNRKRSPIVYAGYKYNNKRCASNSDNHKVVLNGNNRKIDCTPYCRNGDTIVCNNFAAGIILDKQKKFLATVRMIMEEGGFHRRRGGKKRKQSSLTRRSMEKEEE
ncbi:hypothetical protein Trydic_g9264 [Trypoxylus dichotomus]